MGIVIGVAVVGVLLSFAWAVREEDGLFFVIGILMTLLVTGITFVLVDGYYSRQAFAAITACEAKRTQARRQTLTANVVCVPAYRETRNDTTTVNLNTNP